MDRLINVFHTYHSYFVKFHTNPQTNDGMSRGTNTESCALGVHTFQHKIDAPVWPTPPLGFTAIDRFKKQRISKQISLKDSVFNLCVVTPKLRRYNHA